MEDAEACIRYSGVTIRNVAVKESPDWLKQRLTAIGQRPINNIVDVTNYILHGFGQPLHSFDADRIAGGEIIVKTAREGETFVTLDGVERKLDSRDLMICDAERSMCIAGVFGGLDSGVTEVRAMSLSRAHVSTPPMSARLPAVRDSTLMLRSASSAAWTPTAPCTTCFWRLS